MMAWSDAARAAALAARQAYARTGKRYKVDVYVKQPAKGGLHHARIIDKSYRGGPMTVWMKGTASKGSREASARHALAVGIRQLRKMTMSKK